jgi:hypothetical protein
MTADSNRPKNGHDEVRWVHLHPWHSRKAVCGFSMHPAVLMAISDFEIDMVVDLNQISAFAIFTLCSQHNCSQEL